MGNFLFQVAIHHSEGIRGTALCAFVLKKEPIPPWQQATTMIIERFNNREQSPLDENARVILEERLGAIYDFKRSRPLEVTLANWLKCVSTVIPMLRSSAVAFITP